MKIRSGIAAALAALTFAPPLAGSAAAGSGPAVSGGIGIDRALDTSRAFRPQWIDVRVLGGAPGRTRLGYRFYDRARQRRGQIRGWVDWMPLVKGEPSPERVLDLERPAGCRTLRVFVPGATSGRRHRLGSHAALLDGADGPDSSSRDTLGACEVLVHTEAVRGATDLVAVSRSRVRRANAGDLDPLLLVNLPAAMVFDAATLPLQVVGTVWFFACYPRRC